MKKGAAIDSVLTGLLVASAGRAGEPPYMPLLSAILAEEAAITLVRAKKLVHPARTSKSLFSEVSDASFLMVDVTRHTPGAYFYMGLAEALDKTLIGLCLVGSPQPEWVRRGCDFLIEYESTPTGLEDFNHRLREVFRELLRAEALDHQVLMGDYREGVSFEEDEERPGGELLDWSGISRVEHDNLCHELLLHDGLGGVTWLEGNHEIDLAALRPVDDEVHDLFLVSIGGGLSDPMSVQMWSQDFQGFLGRLGELASHHRLRRVGEKLVLNLLFIWSRENRYFNVTKSELQQLHGRLAKLLKKPITLRPTVWSRRHLENLVRQQPTLVRKYFTGEWQPTKVRKSAEDLYRDAAEFARRSSQAAQEIDKRLRLDPGKKWQELAYIATHSIGNAIFPVEVYIDELEEILTELGDADGKKAVEHAKVNVEKAKVHIKKFKSIAANRDTWKFESIDLLPRLERSLDTARSKGVAVNLFSSDPPEILADADMVDEIFDELVANALVWLRDESEPSISVTIKEAAPEDLPASLDEAFGYLWVRFADNGPGVAHELKQEVFELFVSHSEQGMGFGLAIVKKNVNGFGGEVIESGTPGLGAQFDLFFKIDPV